MGRRMINETLEIDNTNYTLYDLATKAYASVRFPTIIINSSTTSKESTLRLNTTGRPVFAICTGSIYPTGTAWIRISLYRDGTLLRTQIVQGNATDAHNPFSLSLLDSVPRGLHQYKIVFTRGGGDLYIGSNTGVGSPVFSVFEV